MSAATGKLIHSTKSDISKLGRDQEFDLETPFFLGVGADGNPRLVVATKRVDSNWQRMSTVLISTGTGELSHVGNQLEHPLQADGDGDGRLDLFLIKPGSHNRLKENSPTRFTQIAGRSREPNSCQWFRADWRCRWRWCARSRKQFADWQFLANTFWGDGRTIVFVGTSTTRILQSNSSTQ